VFETYAQVKFKVNLNEKFSSKQTLSTVFEGGKFSYLEKTNLNAKNSKKEI